MSQIPDNPVHKNTFFPLVLRVANEVLRVFAGHVGASPTRLYILSLLFHHREMTQAELKRHLGLDPAAVSRHLHILEEDGIVSRRINPDHHRQVLVSLTGAGCQYLADLASAKDRLESQLFDEVGISPQEHAIVNQVLLKIDQRLLEIRGQDKSQHEPIPLGITESKTSDEGKINPNVTNGQIPRKEHS
jgi:DNA-binding MarR family transcriptional regulator